MNAIKRLSASFAALTFAVEANGAAYADHFADDMYFADDAGDLVLMEEPLGLEALAEARGGVNIGGAQFNFGVALPNVQAPVAPTIPVVQGPSITAPSAGQLNLPVAPAIAPVAPPAIVTPALVSAPIVAAPNVQASIAPVIPVVQGPAITAPSAAQLSVPVAPAIAPVAPPAIVTPALVSAPIVAAPNIQAPSTPVVAAPTLPQIASPVVPIIAAPTTPAIVAPTMPVIAAPQIATPTTPAIVTPTMPVIAAPQIATPTTPAVLAPTIPPITTPTAPAIVTPTIPQVSNPVPVLIAALSATSPAISATVVQQVDVGEIAPVAQNAFAPLTTLTMVGQNVSIPLQGAVTSASERAPNIAVEINNALDNAVVRQTLTLNVAVSNYDQIRSISYIGAITTRALADVPFISALQN